MATYIILITLKGGLVSVTPDELEVCPGTHQIEWRIDCAGGQSFDLSKASITFQSAPGAGFPFNTPAWDGNGIACTDTNTAKTVTDYRYSISVPGGNTGRKNPIIRNRPN